MRRVRGIAAPETSLDRAWPIGSVLTDPFAGDEALPMRGSHRDYLDHAARLELEDPLDAATHDEVDGDFERVYRSILDGECALETIAPLAERLLVWGATRHDRRPLSVAPVAVDDRTLSDMAENQLPQVGSTAPDRILGPWADEPLPRWMRVVAAAAMCFVPEVPPGVPSWARSIKRRPRPSHAIRASIRAAARTPPMIWCIGKGDMVQPLLALSPLAVPDGPVAGLPTTPAVVGRAVHTADGWHLVAGLPLPRVPPAESLEVRLRLELIRLRRRERRLSWEDLLRERSEVLYRTACEWLYEQLAHERGAEPPWA